MAKPREASLIVNDREPAPVLSLRKLKSTDATALAELFAVLVANGDTGFFEPHPMTATEARNRARYAGTDIHVVAEEGGAILGYGLLRGWDEGYATPSLGIAVHPAERGAQIGRLLMHYMHAIASRRGAAQVRLRVRTDNRPARSLYESLGYRFGEPQAEFVIGLLDLGRAQRTHD